MYANENEILQLIAKHKGDTSYDIVRAVEELDISSFIEFTGGTKGDYYHKRMLNRILKEGYQDVNPRPKYADGTPAYTISVNESMQNYDLSKGESPLLTLRPIAWKSAVKEILWIYQLQDNKLSTLHDMDIYYWDEWDIGDGTIGQRYGATVRKYDLMNELLSGLQSNPYGRRHIMSMWQNEDFKTPGLPPCCFMTTWNVRNDGNGREFLDMEMKQRSSDFATSVSINELQYIALLLMVARHCGYEPGVFTHITTNVQIYDRHIDNVNILLSRHPVPCKPNLVLDTEKTNFYEFTIDDFILVDYPVSKIKEINPQLKFDLGI